MLCASPAPPTVPATEIDGQGDLDAPVGVLEPKEKIEIRDVPRTALRLRKLGNQWQVCNRDLQPVLPDLFDEVQLEPFDTSRHLHECAFVRIGNRWGVLGRQGELVHPTIYDSVAVIGFNHILVGKNGKYGVPSVYGWWMIPLEMDSIGRVQNHWAVVKKNGKYGAAKTYIGTVGTRVYGWYEAVRTFDNNHPAVFKDGQWWRINGYGTLTEEIDLKNKTGD